MASGVPLLKQLQEGWVAYDGINNGKVDANLSMVCIRFHLKCDATIAASAQRCHHIGLPQNNNSRCVLLTIVVYFLPHSSRKHFQVEHLQIIMQLFSTFESRFAVRIHDSSICGGVKWRKTLCNEWEARFFFLFTL